MSSQSVFLEQLKYSVELGSMQARIRTIRCLETAAAASYHTGARGIFSIETRDAI